MKKVKTSGRQKDLLDLKVTRTADDKKLFSLKRNGVQVLKLRIGRILPRLSIECPEKIKKLVRGTVLLVVGYLIQWFISLLAA